MTRALQTCFKFVVSINYFGIRSISPLFKPIGKRAGPSRCC